MKKILGFLGWGFALGLAATGEDLAINSFSGDGTLTWTYPTNGVASYRVEWASRAEGPYADFAEAAARLGAIAPTGATMAAAVPMFYRVVATATNPTVPTVITFITEGASFAPVLTVQGAPEIRWTWADGSTSGSLSPTQNYGSAGTRINTLLVNPWSALRRINIGYDAGDGGSGDLEPVPDQHVSAVQGLELAAPYLEQWCSSYNHLTSLDFSHFIHLDTIECFLSQSLANVNLTDTPALRRACFEDCNLSALDLSQSPLLEDLRGAVNAYPTIRFGDIGAHVWHICVRDNPQLTNRFLFADMAQFPGISELFIWNDNQTGVLKIPRSSSGLWVEADGNQYTALDLEGALTNSMGSGRVSLRHNQLASVNLTGCAQLMELYLENNLLGAAQLDTLLATLDALGRSKSLIDLTTTLVVDIRGNATPGAAGHASAVNLAAKGWRVLAEGWTVEPPTPETGEARIDFTTHGDGTRMSCVFWGSPAATWHWSDGTTSAAISGADQEKTGLGEGDHAHHLILSNGSALTRFGAANGGGQGNLVSISGLNGAPLLEVLFAYNEGFLDALDRMNVTKIREYHLMGTALSPASMDQIFGDAAATGVAGGTLWCPNGGTAASDADRATLLSRGWQLVL